MCSGEDFKYALGRGGDVNTLIECLDPIVKSIACSAFKRAEVQDNSVDEEDIAQEIRIFLWKKLPNVCTRLKGLSTKDTYKYITTLIKNEARRFTLELKCVNSRIKHKRRIRDRAVLELKYENPRIKNNVKIEDSGGSLTSIDLEFFNSKTSHPIENLINIFKDRCQDIPDASKVFEYLTSPNKNNFAGLKSYRYFSVKKEMKQLAKDIAEEVGYE